MIIFNDISEEAFLANYWQKKPLLIKQALPDFVSPVSPNDLAGMSLVEEFESRIVTGSIYDNEWTLRNGPFSESTYTNLPTNDWTLLVQGVDRFVDEVFELIENFDFIPRWRFDDVMMSYAVSGGSVGPHFDYYDVFLLQGSGSRRWHISNKYCNEENYLEGVDLRIMNTFEPEQVYDVEPGDILYIPPNIAHHGVSLDDDCTTLSFGYRAYSSKEMAESIENYDSTCTQTKYYQDPTWKNTKTPALITKSAVYQANKLVNMNEDEFARFVTNPDIIDQKILQNFEFQMINDTFVDVATYKLHPSCRAAYTINNGKVKVFINGEQLVINDSNSEHIIDFCNTRTICCNCDDVFSIQIAKNLFEKGLLNKVM